MLTEFDPAKHNPVAGEVWDSMAYEGTLAETVEYTSYTNWLASLKTAEAVFCSDEKGVWLFATTRAWLDGAVFGLWVRPDKRHSKEMVQEACQVYALALQKYPVLIGYTKKPLTRMHLKMGYKWSGRIPSLWNGEDLDIWTLRREDFVDWRTKLWGINK